MPDILDTHNRISALELSRLVKLNLTALEKDPSQAKYLPPLMVWGAPGLGKSSILRQMALDMKIGFIDVRLAQREPVDIRGLPVPGENGVKWIVSSEWPRDPKSKGIILFDEITAADRSLQVAAYEFILDRRLGDMYTVPDGWYICAAGNRTEDRAVAATMSSALANRFMHVELAENAEDWIIWANTHDIRPEVTGFIRFRPELMFHQKGENLERGWPTPRSWERVSRMLDIMNEESESLIRKMVYGLVGNQTGVEFMEFMKISKSFGDVLKMMTDPNVPVEIPDKSDVKYALVSAIGYFLWRGKDEEEKRVRMDGFYRICMKLSSDFASMAMIDAIRDTEGGQDPQKMNLLFRHPQFNTWAKKHGEALRKHIAF